MTQDAQKFTEEDLKKAREIAHSIPPCDFGSTEAIKVFAQALRDERKGLEARLAEAVRVLMITKEELEDKRIGTDDEGEDYNDEPVIALYNEITDFLSSTTNSEAQERQRAKDKVIEEARKVTPGKQILDGLYNALRALDSLPSEAKGCEHDDVNVWTNRNTCGCHQIATKKNNPTCPFCDKKTGGV